MFDPETGDTDRLDDDRRHGKYYGISSNNGTTNDTVVQESGRDAPHLPSNSNNGKTVTSGQIIQNEVVNTIRGLMVTLGIEYPEGVLLTLRVLYER